jgi:hypothetical protein
VNLAEKVGMFTGVTSCYTGKVGLREHVVACECSICQSDLPEEEARAALWESIVGHIQQFGCSVMGVGAGEGDPSFNYSIGLNDRKRQDLVVVGLDPRVGHAIIMSAVALDQLFEDGQEVDEIIHGWRFRMAKPSPEVLGNMTSSIQYHEVTRPGEEFRAMQILLPDREGRFPGDEGYDFVVQTLRNGMTVQ